MHGTCPHCGYCPHCGRVGATPVWPWGRYPWTTPIYPMPPYYVGDFPNYTQVTYSTNTTTAKALS